MIQSDLYRNIQINKSGNEKMWNDIQTCLSEWLARFKTCGTYLWSKKANDYVNVGATFNSYEIGGNIVA